MARTIVFIRRKHLLTGLIFRLTLTCTSLTPNTPGRKWLRRNFGRVIIEDMKTIDLTKLLAKYKQGWLAVSADGKRFLAKGKTLQEVLKTAKAKGVSNPSVFKAAPVDRYFAGKNGISLF